MSHEGVAGPPIIPILAETKNTRNLPPEAQRLYIVADELASSEGGCGKAERPSRRILGGLDLPDEFWRRALGGSATQTDIVLLT